LSFSSFSTGVLYARVSSLMCTCTRLIACLKSSTYFQALVWVFSAHQLTSSLELDIQMHL
jgi:hypothetical protein